MWVTGETYGLAGTPALLVLAAAAAYGAWCLMPRIAVPAYGARLLIGMCLAAFLIRLVWVLVADTVPVSDFEEYLRLATNIAEHGVFGRGDNATGYRSPGWPFVLSGLVLTGVDPVIGGGLLSSAFAAATLPAIYGLGKAWGGERVAFWAALFWLVFPGSFFGVSVLATEPLFTGLLLWALFAAQHGRDARWQVAAGLLFGAAALVRPEAVGVVVVLTAVELGRPPLLPGRRWYPAIALVICGLCAGAWAARNGVALGRFGFAPTSSGVNFYLANNANATGGYLDPAEWPEPLPQGGEVARDRAGYRLGWEWIHSAPGRFLALVPSKWKHLMGPGADLVPSSMNATRWDELRAAAAATCQGAHVALLLLGFIVISKQRRAAPRVALLMIGLWLVTHVFFHGMGRLHAPLIPIWCLLAGTGAKPRQFSPAAKVSPQNAPHSGARRPLGIRRGAASTAKRTDRPPPMPRASGYPGAPAV